MVIREEVQYDIFQAKMFPTTVVFQYLCIYIGLLLRLICQTKLHNPLPFRYYVPLLN